MSTIQTTQTLEAWKPEIDGFIQDERDNTPKSIIGELSTMSTTNRLQESEITYSGYGPMVQVSENANAVEDVQLEGYRTNWIQGNYRKAIVHSKNVLITDQTGVTKKAAQDLTRTCIQTRDLNFFSLYRNAYNGAVFDGKNWVSTSHPRKDGNGTQTNTFIDGVQLPLSYAAVDGLRSVLTSSIVSNTGNIIEMGSKDSDLVLFVGPKLELAANEIAGVVAGPERPDTTDRSVNFFKNGTNMKVLVSPYLSWKAAVQAGETTVAQTSASNYWDSMWFILDLGVLKQYVKFKEMEGYYYFDTEINKSNESVVQYAYDMYAFAASSFLGIVGSKGDSSTYSS